MSTATLNLAELRSALHRTIDSVAEVLGQEAAFDEAMYWTLDSADAFRLSTAPTVSIGSLADDVEQVRAINDASIDDLLVSPWHDLDHLIGVLTCLSAALRT
jgi:hypothetical protein